MLKHSLLQRQFSNGVLQSSSCLEIFGSSLKNTYGKVVIE